MRATGRAGLPDGRTRLLGIVGDPIAHSLSPRLHCAVLRRLDRNLIYLPFPVSAERLRRFVREAAELGVVGLNVTTPYKAKVARWVRAADLETRRTGVVNTVSYRRGGAVGCGTDGEGILSFLRAAGLGDEPFGVLGFGATARSLVARAIGRRAPLVRIVTRRPRPVRAAVRAWGGAPRVSPWGEVEVTGADRAAPRLWISTLPPAAAVPASFWRLPGGKGILLDLNYGPGRTDRVDRARAAGWRATGGLGPLCRQAALSLGVWLQAEVPAELYFRALGSTERSLRPVR